MKRYYCNVVICWKCDGALEIWSDNVHEIFDEVPKKCPNTECGVSWMNARRFLLPISAPKDDGRGHSATAKP